MVLQSKLFKVAEVQLAFKPKYKIADRPRIRGCEDAYGVLIQQWSKDRIEYLEDFKIILVNRKNRVLGLVDISQGGIHGTLVDPKVVFAIALKAGASGIILSHNHPSGELEPGAEDIEVTKKLKEGAKILDIEILDHLIISKDGYYSFQENGIL
ncbi:DNA repair protein [Pedobacter cryoconitis]|uniref:DNA repair protein n=1 Tax=Pedobacter cryoconitis TaxID=188932 RepID=A0A127VKJ5_9SPHI|nr:JAB domain-containing protein [Pedobacter cryoconitis]AMQ01856.1 DNA repair protein [Pedobacter cryoconitis]